MPANLNCKLLSREGEVLCMFMAFSMLSETLLMEGLQEEQEKCWLCGSGISLPCPKARETEGDFCSAFE